MPGSGWHVTYSTTPAWTPDERKDNFQKWVLTASFRDAFEAFGEFLDECNLIKEYERLVAEQGQSGVSSEQLDDFTKQTATFKQSGIEKKLRKLKSGHSLGLPADLECCVLSLNNARNILSHDNGIVPQSYLDARGVFQVNWKRLVLDVDGPNSRELRVDDTINPGEVPNMRVKAEERVFRLGDRVALQPHEFAGACWTILSAANELGKELERLLREENVTSGPE